MKKLFLFLSISFSLHAQSDSLKVTFSEEKVEKFEKTTLIDEYEKAFGGNRVVKSGLRIFASDPGFINYQQVGFQFEKKLGNNFSIISTFGNMFQISGNTNFNASFESRYYLKMANRIKKELQKPNITGNYIGLKVHYFQKSNPSYGRLYGNYYGRIQLNGGIPSQIFFEEGNISLNFGKQFGNILNLSLQLGLNKGYLLKKDNKNAYLDYGIKMHNLFFTTQNQVGVGLLFPSKRFENNNYCEFLRCQYGLKNLWKINLNNAIYIDKHNKNIKLDIAYERKLNNTPFSLNSNLIFEAKQFKTPIVESLKDTTSIDPAGITHNYRIPIYSANTTNQTNFNLGLKEQLRYYFRMKEKIEKGKQGNNLNGFYNGIEYFSNFNMLTFEQSKFFISYNRMLTSAFSGVLGYQTLTNKYSFLDINLVLGRESIKGYNNNKSNTSSMFNQVHFEFNIKLGLAK